MYTLTLVIIGGTACWEAFTRKKDNYLGIWFLCCIWLIVHDGFRWETGTDWLSYYPYFLQCLDVDGGNFEIGYVYMSKFIRSFTDEYSIFLLFHAVILYMLVCSSIKRYSINPFLTLFLYYCFALPLLGMNRQFIAVGICLFSLRYVIDRKILPFLFFIVLAMLFHKSAIMFLIVYFIDKMWTKKVYLVLILASVCIAVLGVVNKFPLGVFAVLGGDSVDRMDGYTEAFLSGSVNVNPLFAILSILKRLIWIFLLLYFSSYVKNKNRYYSLLFNIYFLSSIIYVMFNNTILQVVVSRGLVYFNVCEIFVIPYVLTIFKNNATKVIVLVCVLLLGVMTMNKGMNSYAPPGGHSDLFVPYKGVFINTEYVRQDH